VGNDPEPFPLVRGTNIGRGVQTPFRIEPERGKRTEDFGCSMSKKLRDVLQQDESGFHVTDDPLNVWPEPTIIVNSTLFPGGREWLAGETGSDDIHSSTPRSTVERGNIIPYRALIQARLFHPFHEDGRCVAVPLNTSHGSYPCQRSESKFSSSVPVAQGDEGEFGMYSHVIVPPVASRSASCPDAGWMDSHMSAGVAT
jgi:hypothetical protein